MITPPLTKPLSPKTRWLLKPLRLLKATPLLLKLLRLLTPLLLRLPTLPLLRLKPLRLQSKPYGLPALT